MPSLILCYAPEDEQSVRELGGYLEVNLPFEVSYGECVVRADFDLVDAAERGLSAEAALVVLSPHSVPKTWKREKWEPVFMANPAEFRTHQGFVLLRDCRFPELLRRRRFFDLSRDFMTGARQIKQWLLHPEQSIPPEDALLPALSELRALVGDRPGAVQDLSFELAGEFASACAQDFEAIHRIDCRGRSRAGILGETGRALGVKLPGTREENRAALIRLCREHRYLLIFDSVGPADREFVALGGLSSSLCTVIGNGPATARSPLDEVAAAFFSSPRDESGCAGMIGDAFSYLFELLATDFEAGLRLGWSIVSALKSADRFAETLEALDAMEIAARDHGDALALFRIEWEQSWMRDYSESSGTICILPTAAPEIAQLALDFT